MYFYTHSDVFVNLFYFQDLCLLFLFLELVLDRISNEMSGNGDNRQFCLIVIHREIRSLFHLQYFIDFN